MKTIRIRIKPDGTTEINVIGGYQGDECLAATRKIEEALGTVTHRERKNQFIELELETETIQEGE